MPENKTYIQKLFANTLHLFHKKKKEADPMKFLVAGLGNMDIEYDGTRHNIGFEIIDAIVNKFEVPVKHERLGDLSLIKHRGRSIYLLKPSTYMNRSGKAVNYWIQKLNVQKNNVLVIVDDLNLDFGRIRLRGKGSDGGHNGLKDVQQYIGKDYNRLRVGIGSRFHKGQQVNYVLGKWTDDEKNELPKIIEMCSELVLSYSFHGLQQTMNKFNN